jgi:hypothetical protein
LPTKAAARLKSCIATAITLHADECGVGEARQMVGKKISVCVAVPNSFEKFRGGRKFRSPESQLHARAKEGYIFGKGLHWH